MSKPATFDRPLSGIAVVRPLPILTLAVGREIAELVNTESDADALVARDELLTELEQSIDL